MKKLNNKLNNKSKGEQLFMLTLMFTVLLGVFCVTGCGGKKSCESPKCGSEDYVDGTAKGYSIPGCGGLFSSGKGCNTACWPQSCKIVTFSAGEKNEKTGEKEVSKEIACDARYYGDGCLGCGQSEKSCYGGYIKAKDETTDMTGFFWGSSDSGEKIIGCYNGCGGCVGTDGIGGYTMMELESLTEVD